MFTKRELNKKLDFIENEKNYYALFFKTLQVCAEAHLIAVALWDEDKLSDDELRRVNVRIETAQSAAVSTHKAYVHRLFARTSSSHTVDSLIESIYSDIFN